MKRFDAHLFDSTQAKKELAEYKSFLAANTWLSEKHDILPFFRAHKHLSAVIGFENTYIIEPDRLAHELKIEGDFQCDLVVGEHAKEQFCFVEFEDAREESVFTTSGRVVPTYSPRLEHGFSQIVDWFCKLSDLRGTQSCEDVFGCRNPEYVGLVVVGRSCTLKSAERARLKWRRHHTVVDSDHVYFLTFDELYDHLEQRLNLR